MELVAIRVRNNPKIKGITIKEIEYKIAQFADDMTLFLKFDTLLEISRLFEDFQLFTGLTVNYDKTSIYRIGSVRDSNAQLYTGKPFVWTNEPIIILGITISHCLSQLQLLNYAPVFDKMQATCDIWAKRKLTLTGKVAIVNNLVGSLLIHKLTALPLMKDIYVQEFNMLVRRFLWDEKKPKIALTTLFNDKNLGGLGLIDIKAKDMAIKTQWVAKCKLFPSMENLAKYYLPFFKQWDINIAPKRVKALPLASEFWQSVLYYWANYYFIDGNCKASKDMLGKLRIANNDMIKIGGTPLTQPIVESLQIIFLRDLLTGPDRHLLNYQDLCHKYGNNQGNKIFRVQSILRALPTSWKGIFDGSLSYFVKDLHFRYNFDALPSKITKLIYQKLTLKELSHGKLVQRWQKSLNDPISLQDMDDAFTSIKELALSSKLRDFQYRFLHCCIYTNKMLYIWKISDTDRCTFCHDYYETVEHLFFECAIVKRFWELFSNWYEAMTDTILNLSFDRIVFCYDRHTKNSKITLLDTLILMAKQFIFRKKCMDDLPGFFKFKDEMFYTCKIERSIAIKEKRIWKFQKKWALFLK